MKPGHEADRLYLVHMLECIDRVSDYVGDDETLFRSSRLVQDAVLRNLQVLAESSQRLSDELKVSEPAISWRAISGFRNILVHDYLGVDVDAIWNVVERELSPLHEALGRMLEKSGSRDRP
ncbi:HepT-like ribonuclease domain-containing protein [Pseudazoarcus pumilus]|uniref:DUF86 domain-containing protein n=1 Tax=Pseudazoarcus pumilus TaxID=2067960 RepID=A0A2I6S3S0_9RHOO|nr:HepT-like ribonuclease domain-containing protein [Pseudazoarcus pumilus]AUN93888.1 DUF86 domain-containing protein [Pseudazoarcus pumilus]